MIKSLLNIVDEIDKEFTSINIDFQDDSWRECIPSEAGWYLIKTTTPIAVLKSIGPPKPENKAHINIPKTIISTEALREHGILITQSQNEYYVVYNGEAQNLKARAREHISGHAKTFCLGLSNYQDLPNYGWSFCYCAKSSYKGINCDKSFRLAVEQAWRAKNGWPILCKK